MIPITPKTKPQRIRLTPIDLQTEIIIPLPVHEIIHAIPTPSLLPVVLLVLHKVQAEFIVGFHTQRQDGEGDSQQGILSIERQFSGVDGGSHPISILYAENSISTNDGMVMFGIASSAVKKAVSSVKVLFEQRDVSTAVAIAGRRRRRRLPPAAALTGPRRRRSRNGRRWNIAIVLNHSGATAHGRDVAMGRPAGIGSDPIVGLGDASVNSREGGFGASDAPGDDADLDVFGSVGGVSAEDEGSSAVSLAGI